MERIRILVVDDELELREMVAEFLQQHGFDIVTAKDGVEMRQRIAEQPFDLLLLDKTMPGEDGFSLARYAREHYSLGIIMLTASNDLIDKVVGLEIGADDYITKPFDLRELHARVKSVLRCNGTSNENAVTVEHSDSTIRLGLCVFDKAKHKLQDNEGIEIPLTSMEYDLLEAFVASPNRVLSRDFLLEVANKGDVDPFDRSIDTRISRLRKKIEIDPTKPKILKTVRNVGYIYVVDADS